MSDFIWMVSILFIVYFGTQLILSVYTEGTKKCEAIGTKLLIETEQRGDECMVKSYNEWLTLPEYLVLKGAE
jgi:hypothetical protein